MSKCGLTELPFLGNELVSKFYHLVIPFLTELLTHRESRSSELSRDCCFPTAPWHISNIETIRISCSHINSGKPALEDWCQELRSPLFSAKVKKYQLDCYHTLIRLEIVIGKNVFRCILQQFPSMEWKMASRYTANLLALVQDNQGPEKSQALR